MTPDVSATAGQYAAINGLNLYYEIHGSGSNTLVLLHGGGSTIESNYGRVLPLFANQHKVIAIELQAHGHTADIDRPLSFEQDADDVVALLNQLYIDKAHFMGFSNGGTTCLQIAIRHPHIINKLVLASACSRRDGLLPGFFEGMEQVTLDMMPAPLKEAYNKVNPDARGLQAMFERDRARMLAFRDIDDGLLKSIKAPALIINADADVVLVEHALYLSRALPAARLAILPGGHGDYLGEICAPDKNSKIPFLIVELVEEFLKREASLHI